MPSETESKLLYDDSVELVGSYKFPDIYRLFARQSIKINVHFTYTKSL